MNIRAFQSCILNKFYHHKLLGHHYIWYQTYLNCSNRAIYIKSLNNPQSFLLINPLLLFRMIKGFNLIRSLIVRSIMASIWEGIIGRVIKMLVVLYGPVARFAPKFYESKITEVVGSGTMVSCWLVNPGKNQGCIKLKKIN